MERMDLLKKSKPILYDPMIIPRVKQYLEENVHQTYVDVGVMARLLQERYREYSRRKSVPFRQLVEQAYKTVLHSYGLDSNPSSEENDDVSSDLEMMDDRSAGNHMNNVLTNMYVDNSNKPPNDGVLIDISSDESGGDEDKQPKAAKTAAAPTSINQVTITKLNQKLVVPLKSNTTNSVALKKESSSPEQTVIASFTPFAGMHPSKKRKLDNNIKTDKDKDAKDNSKVDKSTNIGKHESPANQTQQPSASTSEPTAPKIARKYKKEVSVHTSMLTFQNIGGMDNILKELCELLLHIKHPEVYKHIGLPPPRGILLHGPPGCGKTLLAQAIAGQLKVGIIQIAATELVGGISGESEERIRELFEQAVAIAPCVLFIDEIDAISSNRLNAQKDMERRIVSQLLSSLDGLSKYEGGYQVLVIGSTNRPEALDPALRRIGRFDQEICLGIPDRHARGEILKVICDKLKIERPFDYDALAALTPGYVGADLLALASRAASIAIRRSFSTKEEIISKINYEMNSLENMIPMVNLTDESLLMETDASLNNIKDNESNASDCNNKVWKENGVDEYRKESNILNGDEVMIDITEETKTDETIDTDKITDVGKNVAEKPAGDKIVAEKVDVEKTVTESEAIEISSENTEIQKSKAEEVIVENMQSENKSEDVIELKFDTVKKQETVKDEDKMQIDDPVQLMQDASKIEAEKNQPELIEEEIKTAKPQTAVEDVKKLDTEVIDISKKQDNVTVDEDVVITNENVVVIEEDEQHDDKKKDNSTTKEKLVDTLNKNISDKLELTLSKMVNWLSDENPPISLRDLNELFITKEDFTEAIKFVQPSAKREGFITVPDVTWNDIGSLRDIREELQLAVLAPVKFPEKILALGLQAPSGVLLCGPPGCGKTLLAKAIANEAGINFISVKGPELLNMYVGESERAVRQCFQRARNSAPCVIFFDEFDSLCPRRSDSGENTAGSRVVNQLLTEMDGIEDRKGVFLMAATNRPDIVDPAVLRPGRLDKIIYVDLPEISDRAEILEALTKKGKKPILAEDVDISELASLTNNYTGADLAGLVRQASLHALKDSVKDTSDNVNDNILMVKKEHFLRALQHIRPSVSEQDKRHYEKLRQKYAVAGHSDK